MTSSDVAGPLPMSAKDPVISVIIPAFNRNHTLPRALTSVIDQSFRDLEIIIVDDGSREPVEQVVASFKDSRVRLLLHKTNRGANAARNTGIRAAKGEYLAFLDSDDEWDTTKLELQVKALQRAPLSVGAHYTGYTAFLEDGTVKLKTSPVASGNLLPALLRLNEIGTLSVVMVRRSVLDDVGLFDENLPAIQDWDLYIRIAHKYQFATISAQLVRYYFGKDSITQNFNSRAVGLDMVLEKHGAAMSNAPRAYSRLIVRAGHFYCRSGSVTSGRPLFLRAIRVNPLCGSAYLFLFLSLLGDRFYNEIITLRHNAGRFV